MARTKFKIQTLLLPNVSLYFFTLSPSMPILKYWFTPCPPKSYGIEYVLFSGFFFRYHNFIFIHSCHICGLFLLLSYIPIWRKAERKERNYNDFICLKEFLLTERLGPYLDIDKDPIIIFRSSQVGIFKAKQYERIW